MNTICGACLHFVRLLVVAPISLGTTKGLQAVRTAVRSDTEAEARGDGRRKVFLGCACEVSVRKVNVFGDVFVR